MASAPSAPARRGSRPHYRPSVPVATTGTQTAPQETLVTVANKLEGHTVPMYRCHAEAEAPDNTWWPCTLLAGTFDVVEYHPHDPDAGLINEPGYTVCPESTQGPDYFVAVYNMEDQLKMTRTSADTQTMTDGPARTHNTTRLAVYQGDRLLDYTVTVSELGELEPAMWQIARHHGAGTYTAVQLDSNERAPKHFAQTNPGARVYRLSHEWLEEE